LKEGREERRENVEEKKRTFNPKYKNAAQFTHKLFFVYVRLVWYFCRRWKNKIIKKSERLRQQQQLSSLNFAIHPSSFASAATVK
jgi:hypothetical protein